MGSLDFCGVKVSFVVCFGFFFVFTEMLSIQVLRLHGSPMKADDWQRRMAWLSRSGGSNTDEFQDLILWDDASWDEPYDCIDIHDLRLHLSKAWYVADLLKSTKFWEVFVWASHTFEKLVSFGSSSFPCESNLRRTWNPLRPMKIANKFPYIYIYIYIYTYPYLIYASTSRKTMRHVKETLCFGICG